jgi:hypothetical protein
MEVLENGIREKGTEIERETHNWTLFLQGKRERNQRNSAVTESEQFNTNDSLRRQTSCSSKRTSSLMPSSFSKMSVGQNFVQEILFFSLQ